MTATAIEDPDDDHTKAMIDEAVAQYREKLAGTLPADIIEEALAQTTAEWRERYKLNEMQPEDTRPDGYGKLNETYRWVPIEVPGKGTVVRAWCIEHDKLMTYTLKVDPRYGRTRNKHTRGRQAVVYEGRPVQAWECRDCGQWVVQ